MAVTNSMHEITYFLRFPAIGEDEETMCMEVCQGRPTHSGMLGRMGQERVEKGGTGDILGV